MKEFQYTVKDACGIHARPAGLLVKTVKGFASSATLEKDGKSCDMRKLMALMGMGVKQGETVTVKVEGDENHPVTQGRLCVRCLTLMDYMYNPARIIYPMKRDPSKRGDADAWERCTWDEAVAIIKENYDRITKQYGRESCVCFTGTGREGGTFNPYGSVMLGTPNYCYTQSGYACYIPRLAASSYIIGSAYPEIDYACALPGRFDDPAYELPECLIMWGKMPLSSNGDGLFGHAVIDMMRRGTRLIMVDPRMNLSLIHI